MNNNSMFNPNNQSGLNLVIGSDGLVYNIVPVGDVGRGAAASPTTSTTARPTRSRSRPTPRATPTASPARSSPTIGRARSSSSARYAFFLQPTQDNADDFWRRGRSTRLARQQRRSRRRARCATRRSTTSIPWRMLYRVTYCERFLPPVSTAAVVVPQITPVMAVPVLESGRRLPVQGDHRSRARARRTIPLNDIEANIVLVAPTASGASAGTIATTGPNTGCPILPNNVIPFDIVKATSADRQLGRFSERASC